jgi:polysaccharide pyruvyl transferase CsaB
MKIGIVGNYGHDNNGDEAILQGIIHQLTEVMGYSKKDIVVFSNNPENTKVRYNLETWYLLKKENSALMSIVKTIQQHLKVVKTLDVLIIGGGGLLMDMYKRDAPLYSSLAFIGKLSGCKVIIYGVGAGPIQTPLGKRLIKYMVNAASLTTVRDEKSRNLLQSIGVQKGITIIPDPAFSLGDLKRKNKTVQIKKIGVTAVPYFSSFYWPESKPEVYEEYLNSMASNLDSLIEQKQVEVTLFSSKYPQDVQVTKDICERMIHKDRLTLIEDNLHPSDILNLVQKQDIIIGTRLHSLILSVAAGTPVIGIGYHQKVEAYMKRIEKEELFLSIEDLQNANSFLTKYQEMDNDWAQTQRDFTAISTRLKKEMENGIDLLKTAIET